MLIVGRSVDVYRHKTSRAGQSGQRATANRHCRQQASEQQPVGPRETQTCSLLAPCRSSGGVVLCCSFETARHSTNGPTVTFRFAALRCWRAIGFFSLLPPEAFPSCSVPFLRYYVEYFTERTTTMRFVTRRLRTRTLRMGVIGRAFF